MIKADTAGGMREHLAWAGAEFQIVVREEDASETREVLNPPVEAGQSPDADFENDRGPSTTVAAVHLENRHAEGEMGSPTQKMCMSTPVIMNFMENGPLATAESGNTMRFMKK